MHMYLSYSYCDKQGWQKTCIARQIITAVLTKENEPNTEK